MHKKESKCVRLPLHKEQASFECYPATEKSQINDFIEHFFEWVHVSICWLLGIMHDYLNGNKKGNL